MRGFTLVETLVAITIIALAITGPFYAVQQALSASRSARDQLIASSLAQEGVEYVRGIRDGNYLYVLANPASTRSWLYGLDGTSSSRNCISSDCVVDSVNNTVSNSVAALYRRTDGVYVQQAVSGAVQTPFTRRVRLSTVSGSTTEIVVTVTVSWSTKGTAHEVRIVERLHNWL